MLINFVAMSSPHTIHVSDKLRRSMDEIKRMTDLYLLRSEFYTHIELRPSSHHEPRKTLAGKQHWRCSGPVPAPDLPSVCRVQLDFTAL